MGEEAALAAEVPTQVEQIGVFASSAVSQATLLLRALARGRQGETEVPPEGVDMGGGVDMVSEGVDMGGGRAPPRPPPPPPPPPPPGGGSADAEGKRAGTCYICQQEGHWANNCPNKGGGRGQGGAGTRGAFGAGSRGGGAGGSKSGRGGVGKKKK